MKGMDCIEVQSFFVPENIMQQENRCREIV